MTKGMEALRKYRENVKAGIIIPAKRLKRPSLKKAALAKCKECCSDYIDGRLDCELSDCSLYFWMPYKNKRGEVYG